MYFSRSSLCLILDDDEQQEAKKQRGQKKHQQTVMTLLAWGRNRGGLRGLMMPGYEFGMIELHGHLLCHKRA